jgi:protein-S-isoprenylcysteine O-methyltransferase Ste14
MNPWIAKALVLAGTVVMIAIRAPHGHRSRIVKVATSYETPLGGCRREAIFDEESITYRRGSVSNLLILRTGNFHADSLLETGLLVLAWVGFFVPLIWVASPAFSFAEYALGTGPLVAGVMCLVIGLWLFYRSHADLGTNWSITLEVREQHRLITQGVYRRIRHPMYLALALYSIGQALVIPNWVAGPSNLIAFAILCALRVRAEERMMVEEFGDEYAAYSARTKRLIPGVW